VEDLGWGEARFAEGSDGEGVVALGEARAVFVGEEIGVEVRGSGEFEGPLEEDLAGGGFEEVAAADYFGDLSVGVVDYACELVAGEAVLAPDQEVAEVFARSEGLGAEVFVFEVDSFAVRDTKAVVQILNYNSRCGCACRTATAIVDGLVVTVFVGCVHHAGEVFAATTAGVHVALLEQAVKGRTIKGGALRLRGHGRLPVNPKPCQVFDRRIDIFGFRALGVEVFVAQHEDTSGRVCSKLYCSEGAHVA
jgi:hypothetical protein